VPSWRRKPSQLLVEEALARLRLATSIALSSPAPSSPGLAPRWYEIETNAVGLLVVEEIELLDSRLGLVEHRDLESRYWLGELVPGEQDTSCVEQCAPREGGA
jgi:hypothetical protein